MMRRFGKLTQEAVDYFIFFPQELHLFCKFTIFVRTVVNSFSRSCEHVQLLSEELSHGCSVLDVSLLDHGTFVLASFPGIKLLSQLHIFDFGNFGIENFSHAGVFFNPFFVQGINLLEVQRHIHLLLSGHSICRNPKIDTFDVKSLFSFIGIIIGISLLIFKRITPVHCVVHCLIHYLGRVQVHQLGQHLRKNSANVHKYVYDLTF